MRPTKRFAGRRDAAPPWQNYENWQLGGAKDATQRATGIWKQALTEYQEPAMDPAIRAALDAYVAQRRAEIGSGEP